MRKGPRQEELREREEGGVNKAKDANAIGNRVVQGGGGG